MKNNKHEKIVICILMALIIVCQLYLFLSQLVAVDILGVFRGIWNYFDGEMGLTIQFMVFCVSILPEIIFIGITRDFWMFFVVAAYPITYLKGPVCNLIAKFIHSSHVNVYTNVCVVTAIVTGLAALGCVLILVKELKKLKN